MAMPSELAFPNRPIHPWLKRIQVAAVPGTVTPLLGRFGAGLQAAFRRLGHSVGEGSGTHPDIVITTARFGEVLGWRKALLFSARRRFGMDHTPLVFTVVHITPTELAETLAYFDSALRKSPPRPEDFSFPGLAPKAWSVLVEQGLRGGPILSLLRLVQSQAKCIRVILVVGDETPREAYHFDLVGAFPRSDAAEGTAFYDDIVLRAVTAVSTGEVTQHQVQPERLPYDTWTRLTTPHAMRVAGRQLGVRKFFTNMIRIADLVQVPAVGDSVASQYSEGCYATWDSDIEALVATVTGSARPVDKGNIADEDLALIVGVREDGRGALVQEVEGKANLPPSSEAVELRDMDAPLPTIQLSQASGRVQHLPVVRSKLHGHRGIQAYDPSRVEYVPLDAPYFYYIVSCATQAQAVGIKQAFSRSEALTHPEDPRQVVFTILPGHGVVIVEKWVANKAPFETIWEFVDQGAIQISNSIPQGPMRYDADGHGLLRLSPDPVAELLAERAAELRIRPPKSRADADFRAHIGRR